MGLDRMRAWLDQVFLMSFLRLRAAEQIQSYVQRTSYHVSRSAVVDSWTSIYPLLSSRKYCLFSRERAVKYWDW